MKTIQKFLFLLLFSLTVFGCKENKSSNDYLRKVLNNLEKIESATYFATHKGWMPGDTIPYFVIQRFYKEYNNPSDTTIGASYIWFDANDTTQFKYCYNGNISALTYHDKKVTLINDFSSNRFPFRQVPPPFFNYTKSIIRYALEPNDSITLSSKDSDDLYYLKIVINKSRQVEFFGKAYDFPCEPFNSNGTSIYELWISKSNNLPYKIRREMSHQTTDFSCSNVKINQLSIKDFNVYDYFPPDYTIKKYGEKTSEAPKPELIGKKAPDWILQDGNGQKVSLADFRSKVLIINFTGIGCGHCMESIPFLKGLKERYSSNDVDIVAIENWKKPLHSLLFYADKNNLNYKFVSANDEVATNYYQTSGGVPVFIILDKQRIVRKVINGYEKSVTDKEITDAINLFLPE